MAKVNLVNFENVCVSVQSKQILDNVSLSISKGEILTLIGPNGAGKSTLIKVMLGLMPVSSGKVQLAKGIKIGYMPQRLMIEDLLPITVERFMKLSSYGKRVEDSRLLGVLNEVGVLYLRHKFVQTLSGGELQRVLFARALINDPDLLVLDEPAQGVDLNGQGELYRLIKEITQKRDCGILLVSHDLNLVMAGTGTVVCLNTHICCQGLPEEVSRSEQFKAIFGHLPGVALYTHHHNHEHPISGVLLKGKTKNNG